MIRAIPLLQLMSDFPGFSHISEQLYQSLLNGIELAPIVVRKMLMAIRRWFVTRFAVVACEPGVGGRAIIHLSSGRDTSFRFFGVRLSSDGVAVQEATPRNIG